MIHLALMESSYVGSFEDHSKQSDAIEGEAFLISLPTTSFSRLI
jgi:hypothetical protein